MKRRLIRLVAMWLVGLPVIRLQAAGYALWARVGYADSEAVIYVRDWRDA